MTLADMAPQALYLLPPMLLLWPGRGQPMALRCNLASLSLALLALWPPALHPFAGGTGDLTVLAYNLEGGRESEGRLPRALSESGADLLFLQETEPNPKDPMPAIERSLPGWSMARGSRRPELIVMSRHPLGPTVEVHLRPDEKPVEYDALTTNVTVAGRSIFLIDVHLSVRNQDLLSTPWRDYPAYLRGAAAARREQFAELDRLVASQAGPVILAGDFNSPPQTDGPRLLRRRLVDSFAEAGLGWGLTYREGLPLWRIDYVWHTPDLRAVAARSRSFRASDHLAMEAVLSVGRP